MNKAEQKHLYESIGNQIRLLRKKAGISQNDLAKKLNLSRVSIVNIEKGRQHPSIHMLIDISRIFSINLSELLLNELWKSTNTSTKFNRVKKIISMSTSDDIESEKIVEFLETITKK